MCNTRSCITGRILDLLSLGTAESQAIDDGWPVCRADYKFVMSEDARELMRQEGIIVLSYKPLQAVWRGR